MRKTASVVAISLLLSVLAVVVAPAASAAPQDVTSTFTSLSGATDEQTLVGVRALCDDCAPDDLFECGDGCEIAGGAAVSVTSSLSWTAPFDVVTTFDPDTFHQGTFTQVSNTVTPRSGPLTLRYALHYTIGIFGRGGDFPSDDWHPSTDTVSDTVMRSATASCTPPAPGGGNTTCSADVSLPFFDDDFLGGAVDIIVSLIVHNTITISPAGFVVHRETSLASPENLTFSGSSVNESLAVPCAAAVGSQVTYALSNPSYGPAPVSVTGSLALGFEIDGTGPLNDDGEIPLPISGNVFSGSIGLSQTGASVSHDFGPVLADNVAPLLNATIPTGPFAENSAISVTGSGSDNCPISGSIDWDEGTVDALSGGSTSLPISRSHTYGDNGGWEIQVCVSDAYVSTCRSGTVTLTNVRPTATIGAAGQTLINGQTAFFAHAGQPVTVTGRSTDPGSDDLTLAWDWGDGAPSPDVTRVSLVNPPLADPALSPSVQPRDEPDVRTHTFGDACLYTITFASRDDDGDGASATARVVIVGNASRIRSAGYWQTNMVSKGTKEFSATRLNCYLATIGFLSSVFNGRVDASTIARAASVLKLGGASGASVTQQFDRQLLAAWLNFVNGSIAMDQLVDTNGDAIPDTTFASVIATAEAIRLNPASTSVQLTEQKNILERVNLSMGG